MRRVAYGECSCVFWLCSPQQVLQFFHPHVAPFLVPSLPNFPFLISPAQFPPLLPLFLLSNPKTTLTPQRTIGTYPFQGLSPSTLRTIELDYPLAAARAFAAHLAPRLPTGGPPFRFVHLSGRLVVRDQDAALWLMSGPRRLKGAAEVALEEFAKAEVGVGSAVKGIGGSGGGAKFEVCIMRPAYVYPRTLPGFVRPFMGRAWSVAVEELGAAMVDASAGGTEWGAVVQNRELGRKGRGFVDAWSAS